MIPKVVIVGRPNVGKSSLLNLLTGRLVSIVDPTAGVTRDRVATVVTMPHTREETPRSIELIDTGGYGIIDTQGLTEDVERQIALGLAEADLIMFVVDGRSDVTDLDQRVAQMLRAGLKQGRKTPIMLVANKIDAASHEAAAHELARLGFGEPHMVSATSGHRKGELFQAIAARIDWPKFAGAKAPDHGMLLAIIGKRNAGKSTLVNAMAGQERVIVSEKEGTTRDSIDVRFEMDGKVFTAIDTAGVRKTKSLAGDIEFYSHHRSLRSIRRADVVMLLIDASIPVSQVDQKLGNELQEHFKPSIVVVNKWDLAEKNHTTDEYVKYLDKHLKGLSFAPIVFITAARGEGVHELVQTALSLHAQAGVRVTTSKLNEVMETVLREKTPTSGIGRHPKVFYATQLQVHPPTIALFVNDPDMFDVSYQRFLLNRFRDLLPFGEVPIRLIIRGRSRPDVEGQEVMPRARPARGGPKVATRGKSRGPARSKGSTGVKHGKGPRNDSRGDKRGGARRT